MIIATDKKATKKVMGKAKSRKEAYNERRYSSGKARMIPKIVEYELPHMDLRNLAKRLDDLRVLTIEDTNKRYGDSFTAFVSFKGKNFLSFQFVKQPDKVILTDIEFRGNTVSEDNEKFRPLLDLYLPEIQGALVK